MAENKDDPGSATKFTQARKATQTQGATVDAATHNNTAAQDRGSTSESTAARVSCRGCAAQAAIPHRISVIAGPCAPAA